MSQMDVHDIMDHMIRADMNHRALCDRELSSLGMHRSQLRMLMHLSRHGSKMSQRQLAKELHISPAVVTVTLQKLESEGYVKRTSSDEDRRSFVVALAPRGENMVGHAHGIFERVDQQMLSGFSEEDKRNLVAYYKRMLDNLQTTEGETK